MPEKKEYKGVFIPREVWENPDFRRNRFERDLLVEIFYLDNSFGCVANNRYFADFFVCTQQNVSKAIKALEEKGYLMVTYSNKQTFDGRVVKVNKAKYYGTDVITTPQPEVEPPQPEVEPPQPEVEPPQPEVEHNKTFNITFNKTREEEREKHLALPGVNSLDKKERTEEEGKEGEEEESNKPKNSGVNSERGGEGEGRLTQSTEEEPSSEASLRTEPEADQSKSSGGVNATKLQEEVFTDIDNLFREFWDTYPKGANGKKNGSKAKALIKFRKLIKNNLKVGENIIENVKQMVWVFDMCEKENKDNANDPYYATVKFPPIRWAEYYLGKENETFCAYETNWATHVKEINKDKKSLNGFWSKLENQKTEDRPLDSQYENHTDFYKDEYIEDLSDIELNEDYLMFLNQTK